jgi:hypothetical protein
MLVGMKRRIVVVTLAFLLVAAAATYFYAARQDVAPGLKPAGVNIPAPTPTQIVISADPPEPHLPAVALPSDAVNKTTDNSSTHSWPSNIEARIWEYFAHRQKTNIISINSVECTETNCVIEFSSTDTNPQYVDAFSDLTSGMYTQNWNVQSGSIGTREIAPGARVFVISISNVPVDMDRLGRGNGTAQQQPAESED